MRVCIIDQEGPLREGLRFLLHWVEGYQLVGAYATSEPAIQRLPADKPDLVVMELQFVAAKDDILAIQKIKRLDAKVAVLVISTQTERELVIGAFKAGADGYLTKDAPLARVMEAIRELQAGGVPLSRPVARTILEGFHRNPASPLSRRETEVVGLLARGKSSVAIADALFVDKETVRTHLKNIYRKLRVHSRAAAIKKALDERLI